MWLWKFFILLHIFCVFSGAMSENSPKKLNISANEPWENDFRLPSTVQPDHYDLYLYPDLSTKTFTGSVSINVTSSEAREYFLIHTKWLNISKTKLYKVADATPEEIPIVDLFEYEPNEFWVIRTNQVEPGTYRFTMDFSGSLTNGILGFYYSEYTDDSGNKKGLATTKFEPTYARRAFPCFDEPSFKSTYSVTVVRPSDGYTALSNMPVQSEKSDAPSAGLTEVTFEKSVPMVTYLVCYIVCDFTYKETVLSSGMPFRVYAPASSIENTQFSMDVGASILQMYEQMFELPFPLPKSDMAGIPDYSSGATEHWGIITFRETNIFYNQNQSSAANKQRVASVVAHELAHQWFGNLVTLEWWNDLWLNEGFASYVEGKGVNHVFPEWQMDAQFPVTVLQDVFIDDSKLSSHPIVQPVANNDDINAMFNSIAYDKGSSVLRMLEDFMGESSYQAGINSFLKKYAYGNAVTADLWTELTAAWVGNHPDDEKSDVGAIMDTWTRQMGYPVVSVSRLGPDSFNISQKRFLQDPTAQFEPSDSPFAYKWDIPVSFISSANNTVQKKWLYSDTDNMVLQLESDVTWIKVNIKQKGFYRVNYDPDMWSQLEALCTSKVLDASERASLLNDALALADAALLDYAVALNMTRMLASDTEYVPWNAVSGQLTVIEHLLHGTDASQVFKSYVSSLANPLYQDLGWEDTGEHLQKLLRIDVVTVACASENDACLAEASQLLKSWISDAAYPLPLGTKRQIYRWGIIREGSQENWDVMWDRALVEQSATETDNLYYGMANSQDSAILLKYIQLAQDEQNVRSQNFLNILQYISSNPAGSDLVWEWVRSNWEWLVDRYTLNDRYLGQLIPNISKYFTTNEKLHEMEDFFLQYPEAGAGEMSRQEALETLKFNIHWVEANSGVVAENSIKGIKTSANEPWEDDFRLPSTVQPNHYDLYLYPDLSTKTFTGSVSINVTSTEVRDFFLIHTKWLNINQTKIYKWDDTGIEEVPVIELFEYEPHEFLVIKTNPVEPGAFLITMNFSGSLTTAILGFYYSEYTDKDGNKRGLATTKFEPTYARRAFPCFDEPSFKSTYSVTIVRPSEGYIALSNMPVESELSDAPSAGLTEVTFEKSVPMVTYLVCFIVCDFTYKETILPSGMPFRVYAPEDRVDNSQLALDIGASVLQMYENMFDLPFPLPKSDMAAIPDYSSGATEHWGIITFRETNIFYNENQSSAANKQRVAIVVTHELAHQWFGNLVTLEWWNDLWINEGFASYVEFKGVNHVFPEWQMESQFPVMTLHDVLVDDSKLSSHPIVQPVSNNDDISAMFNSIAYDKGSSILRMLEDFMGESYQEGINSFLKKYAYDNAVTEDLWAELTAAWDGNHPDQEKGDIGAIMDTWTRQMGYPLLTVARLGPNTFNITQKRFLQDPAAEYDPSDSPYNYKWDIPVSYTTSVNNTVQRDWLYMDMQNLVLQLDSDVSWIKVNMKQKGFFRVNYDPDMWSQLEILCTTKVFDASERASLLDDALALADGALLDYSIALDMTRMLAADTDYVPWDAISDQLTVTENLLRGTEASQPFSSYVSNLADPIYQNLGWADTGEHLQKLLRIDIVNVACASGNDGCLEEAALLLQAWIMDAAYPLPLGTTRQVYRWGIIREGSQETWDLMWDRALSEQSATLIDNLYYGMANVQNSAILLKYIQLAQDEENVRSQDFLSILEYISSNPTGSELVWEWVRSNWEWLVDRYTLNDRYLGELIFNSCKYFTTTTKLREMEEFFLQYPEAGAGELLRHQALETVKFNINWVAANAETILNWVNSQPQTF